MPRSVSNAKQYFFYTTTQSVRAYDEKAVLLQSEELKAVIVLIFNTAVIL